MIKPQATFKPNEEQKEYTKQLAKDIYENRRRDGCINKNFKDAFTCDYEGFLAQVVLADLFNTPRPTADELPDNGIDIIIDDKLADIKSTPFDGIPFLILYFSDLEKKSNYFILTQIKKDELILWGGISKLNFIKVKKEKDFTRGLRPYCEVEHLEPVLKKG